LRVTGGPAPIKDTLPRRHQSACTLLSIRPTEERIRPLGAEHDRCLEPLLRAGSEAERDAAIERIVADDVQPVIARTLRRQRPEEPDEIASAIHLRVLQRLRQLPGGDPIHNLADYVATISHNAIYDALRRRYPERTRLKNRLRYVITHDRRFALWETASGAACGLAAWSGRAPATPHSLVAMADDDMRDATMTGAALAAIFERAAAPLLLDDLVRVAMALWRIAEAPPIELPDVASPGDAAARFESREAIEAAWREIAQLRPNQRAALLLNLRDSSGGNAAALLVHLGIATVDDIASQLGIERHRFQTLWNELPLDDLTIAAMLGATRQQVINMRKAARQRLARRFAKMQKP
jgi:DNA-directed RNA polymerase specialized sigma24 family protein